MLNAKDVARILGISKTNVYNLFHSKAFPTTCIGKRMLVNKNSFLSWLAQQERKEVK